ncbi:hypothetical protein GOBAR_AA09802 [Gossypium barbadense]|uniref:Uncharacterized protein n=1 Tax=Gossypium barbadense TaxID=3634 RepID=A0A2P5Y5H5_GOSBA|nr:hypothetical protein GOBAR_AA09802 [Gossypium barbadense]
MEGPLPASATYDPSRFKALALPPSLRYLHAILAHTLTERHEGTGVVTTHDAYFLWSMANGHVIAYFIASPFATRRSGTGEGSSLSGPISTIILPHSHQPDVSTGHLEHAKYENDYRLAQFTKEEDPEDITDDVPPCHEDPPTQPPPPHRPVHASASYSDISKRLTRFEQQCFDHIDATLHQICQHLHISSTPPPHEPSSDEDV